MLFISIKMKSFTKKLHIAPFDILNLCFLMLLLGFSIIFYAKIPEAKTLIFLYIFLFVAVFLCAFIPFPQRKQVSFRLIHLIYPIILIPIIFNSLGKIIPYINPHYIDYILIKTDYFFFGAHPTVWIGRFIRPWLTELMQLAYISYYFLPVCLGVGLYLKEDKHILTVLFSLLLGFYVSYLGYLLFPAIGPRFTLMHNEPLYRGAHLAQFIASTLNTIEINKTDAFPSAHTQISLMCVYYAFHLGKFHVIIYGLITSLLIVSAIYCRYHYVIDVIIGVVLAALCIYLGPILEEILSKKSKCPLVNSSNR